MFALSGQLAEFCLGRHGSRFLVDRLKSGTQPERSLVRAELGLPQNLVSLLSNPHATAVILALAQTDSAVREDLLRQVKKEVDAVLETQEGERFFEAIIDIDN